MLPLKPQWDAFTDSLDNAVICFSHDWIRIWIESFIPELPLHIIIVYEDARIIGILPLYHREFITLKLFKRKCLHSFTNNASSLSGLITAMPDTQKVCAAIQNHLKQEEDSFTDIILEMIPEDHVNVSALCSQFDQGWTKVYSEPWHGSYFVDTTGDQETFFKSLGGTTRKSLRAKTNKLLKTPGVEWEFNYTFNEERFKDFMNIEDTGWKHEIGHTIAGSEECARFFKAIAQAFTDKKQFLFSSLMMDGRPLAINYSVLSKGILHTLKTAMNNDDAGFSTLSPGLMMTQEMIKFCFREGISRLDFSGALYEYQSRWTDKINRKYDIMIVKRGSFITRSCIYLKKLFNHSSKSKDGKQNY